MVQKLKEMFCEECDGVTEYSDLADEADKAYPDAGYGCILRGIAKEEMVHKNHIKSILIDIGVPIDSHMCKVEESIEK